MTQLSPQALVDRGFKYTAAGISGADQWQGVGLWVNKEKDIRLRGNISTTKGGTLYLWEYTRVAVDSLEELDSLLEIIR